MAILPIVFYQYHAGCMGFIRASFEPKRSKIGQQTAESWPIYQFEGAGCMRSIRASFEPKRYKIGQEMAELWPIYQWEVA